VGNENILLPELIWGSGERLKLIQRRLLEHIGRKIIHSGTTIPQTPKSIIFATFESV